MTAPDSRLGRIRFALKPASWPKLLVPALVGHGLGVDARGTLSVTALLVGLTLAILDIVFVVCLNDYADREVDALKRRMFPETSQKTIPDGILPARALLVLGVSAGIAAVVIAFVAGLALDRPLLGPWMIGALATFALYSLPPVRLNYRGGGELLETLGVGVLLPALSAYLQCGTAFPPSAAMLSGWTLLAMASAVASGLSDERSDQRGGKRTFVTWLGNTSARRLVEGLSLLGPVTWALSAWLVDGGPPRMVGLLCAVIALDEWWTLYKRSDAAVTDAFTAQTQYKSALHALIWRAGIAWALGLSVAPLLGL